jgi:ankyrin repeat/BTB/POZ domain-containing protein 2
LSDVEYVNNPDMSDIQFLVEGKVFFGHRIILINASPRFKVDAMIRQTLDGW